MKKKSILFILCILVIVNSNFTFVCGKNVFFMTDSLENNTCVTDDENYSKRINSLMEECHIPGLSTCFIYNNNVFFSTGFGYSNIKEEKKAEDFIIYPVGSVTKLITATAVMQIIENKSYQINLDDNISKYIGFDLKNPKYPEVTITIRMLLAHQTSLSNTPIHLGLYFLLLGVPLEGFEFYLTPGNPLYNKDVWNKYPPGENVCYSSINTDILGLLIEKVTDKSYVEYCKENIFKPLEMKNSSFILSDLDKTNFVTPYIYQFNRFIPLNFNIQGKLFPCGGLRTTVLDMSHFLIAYMNNGTYKNYQLLKPETIEQMFTLQYPESYDNIYRYGLGWYFWNDSNGSRFGGHGGHFVGCQAELRMRLDDKLGVIYFINEHHFLRWLKNKVSYEKEFYHKIPLLLFGMADQLKEICNYC